jgi:hypothetical protein
MPFTIAEYLPRSGTRLADGETIGVAGNVVSSPITRPSLQARK